MKSNKIYLVLEILLGLISIIIFTLGVKSFKGNVLFKSTALFIGIYYLAVPLLYFIIHIIKEVNIEKYEIKKVKLFFIFIYFFLGTLLLASLYNLVEKPEEFESLFTYFLIAGIGVITGSIYLARYLDKKFLNEKKSIVKR